MTETQPKTSRSFRQMFSLSRILLLILGCFLIVLVWLGLRRHLNPVEPVPLRIGPKTTVLTEPRREDGTIDYLGHFRQRLSAGVTTGNNAATDLLAALGPEVFPESIRDRLFQAVDVQDLPERQGFVPLSELARSVDPARLGLDPVSSDTADRYRDLAEEIRILSISPPTARGEDYPQKISELQSLAARTPLGQLRRRLGQSMAWPWSPASQPVLAKWLDQNSDALDHLLAAAEKPRLYLPLLTHSRATLLDVRELPVERIVQAGQALAAQAMRLLDQGRPRDAWQRIWAVHRLARLIEQDWSLDAARAASQLEIAAARAASALVLSSRLDENSLSELIPQLAGLDPLPGVDARLDTAGRFRCLAMMVFRYRIAENLPDTSQQVREQLQAESDLTDWNAVAAELNRWYDRIVTICRIVPPQKRRRQQEKFDRDLQQYVRQQQQLLDERGSFLGTIQGYFASNQARRGWMTQLQTAYLFLATLQDPWILQADRNEAVARLRLAQTALALRRYRQGRDLWPEDLQQLVASGLLPAVPIDPFAGAALGYRRDNGLVQLHSVGPDLTDQEGHPETDLTVRQQQ